MTYCEIMQMVVKATDDNFFTGAGANDKDAVIKATTQIYIAQMQNETNKETKE